MKVKLYKQFEHWYHGGLIWIYSDPHFDSEDNLLNWPSDENQIENINHSLGKKDTLIILGDVGNVEWIKKIKNCYKVLLLGNHDRGASNYIKEYTVCSSWRPNFTTTSLEEAREDRDYRLQESDSADVRMFDNRLFDEVYEGPLFISDQILLSHEPIKLSFGYNIHGHCHGGSFATGVPDKCLDINVAADVVNFELQRLDKLVSLGKVEDLHRQAIDRQRRRYDL